MPPAAASSLKGAIKFQTFSKFRPFFFLQFVCLEKCKANSDCAWFTFYHTNNYCHLMSNCNNLEETFCQGTMESWKLFVFSFLAPTAIALKSNAKYSSRQRIANFLIAWTICLFLKIVGFFYFHYSLKNNSIYLYTHSFFYGYLKAFHHLRHTNSDN